MSCRSSRLLALGAAGARARARSALAVGLAAEAESQLDGPIISASSLISLIRWDRVQQCRMDPVVMKVEGGVWALVLTCTLPPCSCSSWGRYRTHTSQAHTCTRACSCSLVSMVRVEDRAPLTVRQPASLTGKQPRRWGEVESRRRCRAGSE
jgi:hypothetical protein